jgi:hypothetical protein
MIKLINKQIWKHSDWNKKAISKLRIYAEEQQRKKRLNVYKKKN